MVELRTMARCGKMDRSSVALTIMADYDNQVLSLAKYKTMATFAKKELS